MKNFIIHLQEKGLAVSTQKSYCGLVERFLSWFDKDPSNAQTNDVFNYLDYLQKRGLQNGTRATHLTGIDHYFQSIGLPNVTAFLEIEGTKKLNLDHIYSTEELAQLYDNYHSVYIQNFDPNDWKTSLIGKWRNYVMLGLLVFQGVESNELDTITVSDVDDIKGKVKITPKHSRGNPRTLDLEISQLGALMYYIREIRPKFLIHYAEPTDKLFFPDPKYKNVKDRHKQSIMPAIRHFNRDLKKLDKDYRSMIQLRTSVITRWIKIYGLRKAQYMAGHKSIVSTEEYVKHDLESLTDDMTKFNPFTI